MYPVAGYGTGDADTSVILSLSFVQQFMVQGVLTLR
jgi:hypothetical protein